jgi:signal recognition particle GTPase
MSTSPANFHDWEYELASEEEFKRDMEQRSDEIADAISERISDLGMSSGHGADEQKLMGRVLDTLFESDIASGTFKRYLFEIWKQRSASTIQDKKKMARAAQVIANLLSPIMRDIVSSDVHREFGA